MFAFEQEGGAVVYRQAVIAQVRVEREVVLYIGPKRYPIPWTEVPAAFAHAERGTLRGGRFVPAGAPPPSASQSFPRLPPPELDAFGGEGVFFGQLFDFLVELAILQLTPVRLPLKWRSTCGLKSFTCAIVWLILSRRDPVRWASIIKYYKCGIQGSIRAIMC